MRTILCAEQMAALQMDRCKWYADCREHIYLNAHMCDDRELEGPRKRSSAQY